VVSAGLRLRGESAQPRRAQITGAILVLSFAAPFALAVVPLGADHTRSRAVGTVPTVAADDVDFTERPRPPEGWSLRAALTRYAQGQPERVGKLLEVVRRIQFGLGRVDADLQPCIDRVELVADALAVWAADPWRAYRPDADVDEVIVSVTRELDALGVPVEERPARASRRSA